MNKSVISFALAVFAAIVHAAPELGATFSGGAAAGRGKPHFEAKPGNQASTKGDSTVIPAEAEAARICAHDPADAKNRITNSLIRKTADGDNIFWLDFNDKFLGEDGRISKDIMGDYLHPTAEGYKIMFGEISAAMGDILAN